MKKTVDAPGLISLIKDEMNSRGLKQNELGRFMGVTESSISHTFQNPERRAGSAVLILEKLGWRIRKEVLFHLDSGAKKRKPLADVLDEAGLLNDEEDNLDNW